MRVEPFELSEQWLPSKDRLNTIKVKFSVATASQIYFWHNNVQKEIDLMNGNSKKLKKRVDYKFNWRNLLKLISKSRVIKSNKIYMIKGFSALNNLFYPISLMLLKMPTTALNDSTQKCIYLNMLSVAPKKFLMKLFGNSYPKMIGRISVAYTINESFNFNFSGMIGAHAFKGYGLKDFFLNRCNLPVLNIRRSIPKDVVNSIIKFSPQINDGRYCYTDNSVDLIDSFIKDRDDYFNNSLYNRLNLSKVAIMNNKQNKKLYEKINFNSQKNLESKLTNDALLEVAREYSNYEKIFSTDAEVIEFLVKYMENHDECVSDIFSKCVVNALDYADDPIKLKSYYGEDVDIKDFPQDSDPSS